jgi:hypothetical protein
MAGTRMVGTLRPGSSMDHVAYLRLIPSYRIHMFRQHRNRDPEEQIRERHVVDHARSFPALELRCPASLPHSASSVLHNGREMVIVVLRFNQSLFSSP